MFNIDLSKARPVENRRAEVIDWRTGDAARPRDPQDALPPPDADESAAEQRLFALAVAPSLTQDARVVEIGPGVGKWTVRIAPLVREVVVVDVSEAMLERTHARVQAAGMRNVSFTLGSGRDLEQLQSERFDLVFGYDVFVHVSLEDTVGYLGEIARVLRDGGLSVLHHAVNDVRTAWDRIEAQPAPERAADHLRGYHYHSRDALDRMYGRFGLRIESLWTDACTTVVSARRPVDSVVPKLEQALRLASASDEQTVDAAIAALQAVGRDLTDRLEPLAAALAITRPGTERFDIIQRIRRLVRG
jgi:ubiquinone/menaquinone biosynthesis C-methylase UbiE